MVGIMVKTMDCRIVVSEFELHLHYYIHPWERYEPPYSPSHGLNNIIAVHREWWLCLYITYKG